MISYDIRDYISLLTLMNAFNSREFRLSDEYLNKNTPLFPDNESYPRSLAKRRRSYLKLNSYFKSLSY